MAEGLRRLADDAPLRARPGWAGRGGFMQKSIWPGSKDWRGSWGANVPGSRMDGNMRLISAFEGNDAIAVDYRDYHLEQAWDECI